MSAPPAAESVASAAARLPDLLAACAAEAARPGADGRAGQRAMRDLLVREVYEVAVRAGADRDRFGAAAAGELDALAGPLRGHLPEGAEDRLAPRPRTLVRLLRRGALEPAWTLARDGASGVVRPARAVSMWAGGSHLNTALPLPTLAEGERVYAWLPGFRDPRWGVPDEVYGLDRDVVLRVVLDSAEVRQGDLVLSGTAHLAQLTARPDDEVVLVATGAGGTGARFPAVRSRYPGRVARSGPELTRLAWSGWSASVALRGLARTPGTWRFAVEVRQGGIQRRQPLGSQRAELADASLVGGPVEAAGAVVRLDAERTGQLLLRIRRLGPSARLVPRGVRGAVRRVLPRA